MTTLDLTPSDFDRIRKEADRLYRETDGEKELARLLAGVNILLDEASNPTVKTRPASFIGTETGILRAAGLILHKRWAVLKDEIRKTGDGTIKVS